METLDEVRKSDKPFLIPDDIAPILGCHPQAIREEARDRRLPFPVILIGNRTKIPRLPFIEFMTKFPGNTGGGEDDHPESV